MALVLGFVFNIGSSSVEAQTATSIGNKITNGICISSKTSKTFKISGGTATIGGREYSFNGMPVGGIGSNASYPIYLKTLNNSVYTPLPREGREGSDSIKIGYVNSSNDGLITEIVNTSPWCENYSYDLVVTSVPAKINNGICVSVDSTLKNVRFSSGSVVLSGKSYTYGGGGGGNFPSYTDLPALIRVMNGSLYTPIPGELKEAGDSIKIAQVVTGENNVVRSIDNVNPFCADYPAVATSTKAIIVLSPNGGENFVLGQEYPIKISIPSDKQYIVYYYYVPKAGTSIRKGDGTAFNSVVGGYSGGATWQNYLSSTLNQTLRLPNDIIPGEYKLKVYLRNTTDLTDYNFSPNSAIASDESDNYFTVTSSTYTSPTPTVTVTPSSEAKPFISYINPAYVFAGNSVTIYGSGFHNRMVVNLNGKAVDELIKPTSVSSDGTKMTFTVPKNIVATNQTSAAYSVMVFYYEKEYSNRVMLNVISTSVYPSPTYTTTPSPVYSPVSTYRPTTTTYPSPAVQSPSYTATPSPVYSPVYTSTPTQTPTATYTTSPSPTAATQSSAVQNSVGSTLWNAFTDMLGF